MKTLSLLLVFLGTTLFGGANAANNYPEVQQQDVCATANCGCESWAEVVSGGSGGGSGQGFIGTHNFNAALGGSGSLSASLTISPQNGYTDGSTDGICVSSSCPCGEVTCGYHYNITISITDWGTVDPSTVDKLSWVWGSFGSNIDTSQGLPASYNTNVDFTASCGSGDKFVTIVLVASFNTSGAEPAKTNKIKVLLECIDCPFSDND